MTNVDIGRYSKRIVQYIWDPEPTPTHADHPSPVWCLGQSYKLDKKGGDLTEPSAVSSTDPSTNASIEAAAIGSPPGQASTESSFEEVKNAVPQVDLPARLVPAWPEAFLDDFESRIWLTYRSGFPEIAKSSDPKAPSQMSLAVRLKSHLSAGHGFSSDTGWGCMIRSGQCVLANTLALLRLGRSKSGGGTPWKCVCPNLHIIGWRRGSCHPKEGEILRLFADDHAAPFSIHRFVEHGAAACGTYPGQWFGPSATAKCIEYAGRCAIVFQRAR